ncbi:hypothetical protein Pmar_PMAR012179, partial [Perkinsus marinus ATCC 50983]
YLGIVLSRLDDYTNSCNAYARAIEDPSTTAIIHLNFAITALNHGDLDEAKKHFLIFDGQYHAIKESGGGNGESQFL